MKNEGIEHGTFWRISIEVQVISGGSSLVTTGNRFENTYNFLSILLNSRNWNGIGNGLGLENGQMSSFKTSNPSHFLSYLITPFIGRLLEHGVDPTVRKNGAIKSRASEARQGIR